MSTEQASPDLGRLIADFRREVIDKLSVAVHASQNPMRGPREVVLKQCEDFLVEQFQSAVESLRHEKAQLTKENQHRRDVMDSMAEANKAIRCELHQAEQTVLALQAEKEQAVADATEITRTANVNFAKCQELRQQKEALEQTVRTLTEYARHNVECVRENDFGGLRSARSPEGKPLKVLMDCTCGLDAALSAVERSPQREGGAQSSKA
jgi:hypothetical protein